MRKQVLIIGSGISGITAAHFLEMKFDVTIVDKGNFIGGRICSRKIDNYLFNHGAQYFTSKTKIFKNLLNLAIKKQVIKKLEIFKNKSVYSKFHSMRSFMSWYSGSLNIKQLKKIVKINYENKKFYCLTNKECFISDAVIVTAPAPQTFKIINNLDLEFSKNINDVNYYPCFCIMILLSKEPKLNFYKSKHGIISLFSLEKSSKQTNNNYLFTIQTNPKFSEKLFFLDKKIIIDKVLREFLKIQELNMENIRLIDYHKWLYSKVKKPIKLNSNYCSEKMLLGVAGDWHPGIYDDGSVGYGERAEDAFLSGFRSAQILESKF